MTTSSQKDLFPTAKADFSSPIVLELSGIKVPFKVKGDPETHWLTGVPSFKTGKRAFAWRDKASGKIMARPITLPHHSKWMELAIRAFVSQLSFVLGLTNGKIQTVASPRSWIASRVPLDDSWSWCPEIIVRSRRANDGEKEGCTLTIERIA